MSDTVWGSHNFNCRVTYTRFLSLREKFLTAQHSSRPNSGSFWWGVIELFAQTCALSAAWFRLGAQVIGLCEIEEQILEAAAPLFPDAEVCRDARGEGWKQWQPSCPVEVICGGPPCTPWSSRGPQHGRDHPQADLLPRVCDVAQYHGARWISLEQVCDLIEEPRFSKDWNQFLTLFRERGFHLAAAPILVHSALGGATRRRRVFPVFESTNIVARLGCWPENLTVDGQSVNKPGSIRKSIDSAGASLSAPFTRGTLRRFEQPNISEGGVVTLGDFWFDHHGSLYLGARVQLRAEVSGCIVVKRGSLVHKLKAATSKFVVVDIQEDRAKLFWNSSKSPLWFWRALDRIKHMIPFSEPVYDIDGCGPTVRSFAVEPLGNSFLVAQSQQGVDSVRALTGMGLWELHGGDSRLAERLLAAGLTTDDLGVLTGRAIPQQMCDCIATAVNHRIVVTHQLEELAQKWNVPWIQVNAPSVPAVVKLKLLLVVMIIDEQQPCEILCDPGTNGLPGVCLCDSTLPLGASAIADGWKQDIITALMQSEDHVSERVISASHILQAGERTEGLLECRVFLLPIQRSTVSGLLDSESWWSFDSLCRTNALLSDVTTLCLGRLASLQGIPRSLGLIETAERHASKSKLSALQAATNACCWRAGKTPVMFVDPPTFGRVAHDDSWINTLQRMNADQQMLKDRLRSFDSDHPAASWMAETADRVPDMINIADVPEELLRLSVSFSEEELIRMRFPDVFSPPKTAWLTAVRTQPEPPAGFQPKCLEDLFTTEAVAKLRRWVRLAALDLKQFYEKQSEAHRQFNEVLVLGQEDFKPEARGIVWDLRDAGSGVVTPVDFSQPIDTHLDLGYLSEQCTSGWLVDYPDQEILSQVFLGVRYKDPLPHQLVLMPPLNSFGLGCVEIDKEMEELASRGWYSFYHDIPFAPGRNIVRGAALKATGEWRPTSDSGQPRKCKHDRAGNPVVPQNELIKKEFWHKEWKANVLMLLQSLALLVGIAAYTGEPLFLFGDDQWKCFNQLRLAPVQWPCAFSMLLRERRSPKWAAEYIMPFGVTCASNIAQAWAHVVVFLVRKLFFEMEDATPTESPKLESLLVKRAAYFGVQQEEQNRLCFLEQFTDDSAGATVGLERFVRLLLAWFEINSKLNILMAPPRKRQVGCALTWIGIRAYTHGIVTTQLQKRVRAVVNLKLLLAGKLRRSALRKLLGLLEHFVFLFCLGRNWMHSLYEPFDSEDIWADDLKDPANLVKPSPHMASTSGRWISFLASNAGVTVKVATGECSPLTESSLIIDSYTDAAVERSPASSVANELGLGGYVLGFWWYFPLTLEAAELHAPLLEAIAFGVQFFVIGRVMPDFVGAHGTILAHCDALATVLSAALHKPKSPFLRFMFVHLDKSPFFRRLRPHVAVTHVAGPGNIMADAASRHRADVIADFSRQIGVRPVQRGLCESALRFIHECIDYARSLSACEQSLDISQPNNPNSASWPQCVAAIPRMVSDDGELLCERVNKRAKPDVKGCSDQVLNQGPESPPMETMGIPRMVSNAGDLVQNQRLPSITADPVSTGDTDCELPAGQAGPDADLRDPVSSPSAVRPETDTFLSQLSPLQTRRQQALRSLAVTAATDIASKMGQSGDSIIGVAAKQTLQDMFLGVLDTVPSSTADTDRRDWELWCKLTTELKTQPWRGDVAAHNGTDTAGFWREVILQAVVFYRALGTIQPRSQRLDPDGNVIAAKPDSVTVIKSVRRIHSYFGVSMATSKLVASVLKTARNQFVEAHGITALLPQAKSPFTNDELARLMTVPVGTQLTSGLSVGSSRCWRSIELLLHIEAQGGFRLGDALLLNRDAVTFDFRDVALPIVDHRMVEAMTSSDYALISPGRSKADRLGQHWSPYPVYLQCTRDRTLRAGALLYQYCADFPVLVADRHRAPLFVDDAGNRLKRPFLERVLKALLTISGICPLTHSWHSFRIYLAMALYEAGADHSRIKAMLRWISDDSLRIYARDSRHRYAQWLRKAGEADVAATRINSLPAIDDDHIMAALDKVLEHGVVG